MIGTIKSYTDITMPNYLANATSPYLLQHAENPVEWYPWCPEALERARADDKPIFLSIGYAACHWCHVMAHESFEDPSTAAILNQHFICIKVDREERPDIDSIYMSAVVAMTGQGGWPLSVFLTPDGQPFFGGTYFPPVRRYNMPAFQEVLQTIARLWAEDRESLLASASRILEHLQNNPIVPNVENKIAFPDSTSLDDIVLSLAQSYDWTHGGWGRAPKFPQPMTIEFLLRRASRGDRLALDMSVHALRSMAKGGMYDLVGGGFSRYSTDDDWRIPHFEKMLYDNAQLALVYLHAYLLTQDPFFQNICEEILHFVMRELMDAQGGFYASLDADSEGVEGKYYLWTHSEIQASLPQDDAAFLIAAHRITPAGNFEGHMVLQRHLSDEQLAAHFSMTPGEVSRRLMDLHLTLRRIREQRTRPGLDDKVLLSWNALMLTAFAEAGRYLKSQEYLEVAMRNGRFLLDHLSTDAHLYRSWRQGIATQPAFLEDYASLVIALLNLYQSNPDPAWFSAAVQIANQMNALFHDPEGGFFDTPSDQPGLIYRPKNLQDNATPSGNSIAALALLQLSAYSGNGNQRQSAENMISRIFPQARQYPTAFANWLCAADFAIGPSYEVVVLGEPKNPQTTALIDVLWETFRPRLVAAISFKPLPDAGPEVLLLRSMVNDLPTAFVCQNQVCGLPTNSPSDLRNSLASMP
jgi:uncharacterized protein YyaL (SSP411 family)